MTKRTATIPFASKIRYLPPAVSEKKIAAHWNRILQVIGDPDLAPPEPPNNAVNDQKEEK